MAFNWWDSFYGQYIGVRIQGQVGKRYIYYIYKGQQLKRRYNVQQNLTHPNQIRVHENFKKANQAWQAQTPEQKETLKKLDQYNPTMSGYNYFISQYLKNNF